MKNYTLMENANGSLAFEIIRYKIQIDILLLHYQDSTFSGIFAPPTSLMHAAKERHHQSILKIGTQGC